MLSEYEQIFFDAFQRLNKRRQFSMAALPLTVEAIFEFCDRFGYATTVEEERLFYDFMEAMDDEYLLFQAEEAQKDKDAKAEAKKSKERQARS